jgi:large subunit ribosomal protein L4
MSVSVRVIDSKGEVIKQQPLDNKLFDCPLRPDILHQVVLWQLAKRRAGSHCVKDRGEVSGSGRKIYRQKGTGRARMGSKRAPQRRGGGVVFGPQPRDHSHKLNKQVRTLGLRIALSDRVRHGNLCVVEGVESLTKTKAIDQLCRTIAQGAKVLIVTQNPVYSARNLPNANALMSVGLNVYDILRHDYVLIENNCLEHVISRLS